MDDFIIELLRDGDRFLDELLHETGLTDREFAAAWRRLSARGLVEIGLDFQPGQGRPMRLSRVMSRNQ
jgi:hypothetical protein